jgi:hypothetical protein
VLLVLGRVTCSWQGYLSMKLFNNLVLQLQQQLQLQAKAARGARGGATRTRAAEAAEEQAKEEDAIFDVLDFEAQQ